jgi:dihydroorotate dehydrogenase electron transfer subunit
MDYNMVINDNIELSSNIYKMTLGKPKDFDPSPGQFVMIECGGLVLRRPLSIAQCNEDILTLLYRIEGKGTNFLKARNPGDTLKIMGPLGKGFPFFEGPNLLIGGGIGVIPLIYLAQEFDRLDIEFNILLGFNSLEDAILGKFFPSKNKKIVTMDGSIGHKGLVTEFIPDGGWDKIYCCGPKIMMECIIDRFCQRKEDIFVSLEERMACGIGACKVCACKGTKDGNLKVCSDGPVFSAGEVDLKW